MRSTSFCMATTLSKAIRTARAQLAQRVDAADLEAELLLGHTIGRDRVWLFTHPERILAPTAQRAYAALLARRLKGEPIAYLLGQREFYGRAFAVNRHTLIPRPETELMVETVLDQTERDQPFQLLDLGTGSGAIGISIALERPNAMVVATDISANALDVARENAQRLKVANIEFLQGSWFVPVPGRRFDWVVSNPPYVESQYDLGQSPDLLFEPSHALLAGPDGLDALQAITAGASSALYPGGHLLLEHGASQAYAVSVLLQGHGLACEGCRQDLAGHDRVSLGTLANTNN